MIKADYSDKSLVVNILSDSFDKNKSVNYVVKQDNNRRERIRRLMEYCFDDCFQFGEVYLSDNRQACALILMPERKSTSLKTILSDLKLARTCIGITRLPKVLIRESKAKKHHPKSPILYLRFIGVSPGEQRKGTGKALLNDIINESIQRKKSIYLETSMPENLPFYKGAGFEVYQELDVPHKLYLFKRNY